MKIYKRSIVILIISYSMSISSQNSDMEFAIYNIFSGTVIGGVGALINKNPNEKFWKTFFRGSSQGAIGGYLNFESKRLIRNFARTGNYGYVWPSRLLNATGNSIIMNGASNYSFGQTWHFNLAIAHLEYNTNESKKFKIRAMPFAMTSNIYGFFIGKLDLDKTLKTGVFMFDTDRDNNGFTNYAFVNTIFFNSDGRLGESPESLAHEIIHTYQYNGTMPLNSFLIKNTKRWENSDLRFYEFYNKYFYTDYNSLINFGVIGFEKLLGTPRLDRIIEIEPLYFGYDYHD